mmetsp:Transcript_21283/g.59228  ORF Transcript_21283/g.59228 Transcript_21283/m.59228 type:complete len:248 (+) Transcript_21283:1122-1865(+)
MIEIVVRRCCRIRNPGPALVPGLSHGPECPLVQKPELPQIRQNVGGIDHHDGNHRRRHPRYGTDVGKIGAGMGRLHHLHGLVVVSRNLGQSLSSHGTFEVLPVIFVLVDYVVELFPDGVEKRCHQPRFGPSAVPCQQCPGLAYRGLIRVLLGSQVRVKLVIEILKIFAQVFQLLVDFQIRGHSNYDVWWRQDPPDRFRIVVSENDGGLGLFLVVVVLVVLWTRDGGDLCLGQIRQQKQDPFPNHAQE